MSLPSASAENNFDTNASSPSAARADGGAADCDASSSPLNQHQQDTYHHNSPNSMIHINAETLETASDLALMVGYKNSDELARRGGVPGIINGLNTSATRGITRDSYESRIKRWGINCLPPIEQETFFSFVKEELNDRTMKILIGAAVISLVLGLSTPDPRTGHVDFAAGWMEGTAILLSVVIVVVVAAVNNLRKQAQFLNAATSEKTAPAIVLREGQVGEIPHEECVVGDIVSVYAGMSLPFDALLIEGTGYSANEASMTGEVDDVMKTVGGDPFLVSGTHIVDGCDGLAVVVAVGERSFSGSIAMSTREQKHDTPLQEHLEEMADIIGRFGLAAAILTFVALLIKEVLMASFVRGESFYMIRVFENLTTAVAIVVVAVPEGLPLSVTLSLAYSMQRMLDDKNLVRHLDACETMGGATCICTDKTGTLTSNQMQVASVYALGNHHEMQTNIYSRGAPPFASTMSLHALPTVPWQEGGHATDVVFRKIADCIALNYSTLTAKSNRTASALLELCEAIKRGNKYDAEEEAQKLDKASIQRFAFSSVRKRGSVVVAHHASSASSSVAGGGAAAADQQQQQNQQNAEAEVRATSHQAVFLSSLPGPAIPGSSGVVLTHYVAGAAELILQKCASYVTPDGRRSALTAEAKSELDDVIRNYAGRGWRTLCLGLSERRANWTEPPKIAPDDPLTFLAMVGIAEPLRPEVPQAIRACAGAGVRTIMVTGDNVLTASHIALQCGILAGDAELLRQQQQHKMAHSSSMSPVSALAAAPDSSFAIITSGGGGGGLGGAGAGAASSSSASSAAAGGGAAGGGFSNSNNDGTTQSLINDDPTKQIVIDGVSFREKSDEELIRYVIPRLAVLARASPLDKKRLVQMLHADVDAVVAVTGDGTNDAPALKAADIGFAMNSGSDIAKSSSDIVLLDDNFTGVVKGIIWGRNVRDNIKKFLQFQLTVNGVACLVAFLGALVNTQNLSPLKPVQLLWLNLIMDTFAALALATELPHDASLLSRGPEPRTASMISPAMRTNIAAQGIFQLTVQLLLLLVGEHLFTGMAEFSDIHVTVVFNTFVMMQLFNFFNARKLTHADASSGSAATTSLVSNNGTAVVVPTGIVSSSSSADNVNNENENATSSTSEVVRTAVTDLHGNPNQNNNQQQQGGGGGENSNEENNAANLPHGVTRTTVWATNVVSVDKGPGGQASPYNSDWSRRSGHFFTSLMADGGAASNIVSEFIAEIKAIFTRSVIMLYIILTIFLAQIFIVQFGGKFMSTVPLDVPTWVFCIFVASFSLPVGAWSRRAGAKSVLASWATQWFQWMMSVLTKGENCVGRLRGCVWSASKEKVTD